MSIGTSEILGIDIGRVIIGGANDGSGKIFNQTGFLSTPFVDGVVSGIKYVVDEQRFAEVHLLSRSGATVQHLTNMLLSQTGFFDSTGLDSRNVHYCLRNSEKTTIAAELGITHFIDDRYGVLATMEGIVRERFWFTQGKEITRTQRATAQRQGIEVTTGWTSLTYLLSKDIEK